jgi:branched-chain amino acid transport system substrate-binding protein
MRDQPSNRRRLALRVLAALWVAVLAVSGCSAGSNGNGPIRIGATLGLTGSLAAPASEYQAVYDAWQADINAKGGLLGRKVELLVRNDNSTAATAVTLYQSMLTRDKVDFLLAPYASYIGAAVVPIAKSAGKLLINGGFTDPSFNDEAGGSLVSAYPYQAQDYTRGVFEAIGALPPDQRPKRVGFLTVNNPFTLADRDGFNGQGGARHYAEQAGMDVVLDETYANDATDFTALVGKARAAGVQFLLVLGLPEDSATVVKTVKTMQFTPEFMCACGSQVLTLPSWSELGNATDRVLGTTVTWPSLNYPGTDVLQRVAKERHQDVISSYGAVAYASLQILQQAVEGAGTVDESKVRDYIYSHTFDTVVGPLKFHPNGVSDFHQVVLQTIDGRAVPVWPADVAESPIVRASAS